MRVGLVAVASGRGTYCGLQAVPPHLSVFVLGDTSGPMPGLSRHLILGFCIGSRCGPLVSGGRAHCRLAWATACAGTAGMPLPLAGLALASGSAWRLLHAFVRRVYARLSLVPPLVSDSCSTMPHRHDRRPSFSSRPSRCPLYAPLPCAALQNANAGNVALRHTGLGSSSPSARRVSSIPSLICDAAAWVVTSACARPWRSSQVDISSSRLSVTAAAATADAMLVLLPLPPPPPPPPLQNE